jgi:dihydroorotate dehydrogenase (NAD+) catalytic subunit
MLQLVAKPGLTVEDALEFLIAGASAVQIGTANFVDPFVWQTIINGLEAYCGRHHVSRISDLVGALEP